MTITNYPNGVSSFGIPQIGNGDIPSGGEYFFVDSNNGSDGYEGTWDAPFATLDYAVGKCTADKSSVIVIKPNHAETLIADSAVDIDVAGVAVVGLGDGDDRPTFTFTTAVTADFKLAANNVSIRNLVFVAGVDALTGPIEVSGDYCSIVNCEWQENVASGYETTDVIVTASTPLHMTIDGFKYVCDGGTTGGTQNQSVIQLNGADFAIIRNCLLVADSGTGVIEDATTSDQILIENCIIDNSNVSPVVGIALTGTTTGSANNTYVRVASGTTYVTADNDMQWFECYGTGTDATAGDKIGTALAGDIEAKIDVIDGYFDVPTADATTNVTIRDVVGIKTDAAVQTAGTTKSVLAYAKGAVEAICGGGITSWPTAAAYANGISLAEVLAYIQNAVRNGTGTALPTNTSLYDMVGGSVTTGTAVIANGTATAFTIAGGPIEVENILAVCVTPNDATATTLKFTADPTDGTATDLCAASATLANATAGTIVNITGTLANAGVITANGTAISQAGRIVVPAGVIQTITGVGATTGTWYVAMKYKALRPGVTVTAAY